MPVNRKCGGPVTCPFLPVLPPILFGWWAPRACRNRDPGGSHRHRPQAGRNYLETPVAVPWMPRPCGMPASRTCPTSARSPPIIEVVLGQLAIPGQWYLYSRCRPGNTGVNLDSGVGLPGRRRYRSNPDGALLDINDCSRYRCCAAPRCLCLLEHRRGAGVHLRRTGGSRDWWVRGWAPRAPRRWLPCWRCTGDRPAVDAPVRRSSLSRTAVSTTEYLTGKNCMNERAARSGVAVRAGRQLTTGWVDLNSEPCRNRPGACGIQMPAGASL